MLNFNKTFPVKRKMHVQLLAAQVNASYQAVAETAFAEVRDNGPGLGPAEFAKIFAPPARLTPDTSKQGDSSGLGLVIARELLTLQGGRLEVQSHPGSGAVFRVLLPVAQPAATV